MNGQPRLNVKFGLSNGQLALVYEVVNAGHTDLYLLNRLYRSSPKVEMSPDVIYVHLDSKTRTVMLAKKLADLPSGVNVTAPVAPYVTPVRAGEVFREEVHIPIPVREYRQYPDPTVNDSEASIRQVYRNVAFVIGYYWRPPNTVEQKVRVGDSEVIIPKTPAGARLQFGQLESGPYQFEIPVMEPVRTTLHVK